MRSMVEGVRHTLDNQLQDRLNVPNHVASNYAKNPVALLAHVPVAMLVPIGLITEIVRISIDLYDKPCLANVKVCHIGSDRVLSTNLESHLASPKLLPKQRFRWAHRAP